MSRPLTDDPQAVRVRDRQRQRRRALRALGMPRRLREADGPSTINWAPQITLRLAGGGHVICLNYMRGVVEFATAGALRS